MKVLLTGATGFIGSHVLRSLQRCDIEVVVVGRSRPQEVATFVEANLLDLPDFTALMSHVQATHLLHLAWYAEHGKYWDSPLNLRWTEATVRLVEAFCMAGGQQVVISGTCAEYDWTHGYCREDCTPIDPATLYGIAKDATRRLVMAICGQYQVPCAWGRVFFPFGHGEASSRLMPSLVAVFRGEREPFAVNTKAYRDFLHVSDVSEGFVRLLIAGAHGAYNICSGKPVCLADIVTTLASLLGASPDPVLALTYERTGDPCLLIGDNRKLENLEWSPLLTLKQGIEFALGDC